MYFNKEAETMPREQIKELQSERLVTLVKKVYDNVPFYKKKFDEMGLKPEDIKGLDDIVRLPFTVKQDLRDNYPFHLFAVPMKQIVRVHASSGTTGKPTTVGYTKKDIDTWAELAARSLGCAGADDESIVDLVAVGYVNGDQYAVAAGGV